MPREKWYFRPGEQYQLSEVVGACDERIRKGGVRSRDSKNESVRRMERCGYAVIVWTPKSYKGWGASPFNLDCWRTVSNQPIVTPGDRPTAKSRESNRDAVAQGQKDNVE